MNLQEATRLISNQYITSLKTSTIWADLGCGNGLFTHALAGLLQPGSLVMGIDKRPSFDPSILSNGTELKVIKADFENDKLPFEAVNGIMMANSFHYVSNKEKFIEKLSRQYKNIPAFILVEYETRLANEWVPYPIDFLTLEQLFKAPGFSRIEQIGKHPSVYSNGIMYAALAIK